MPEYDERRPRTNNSTSSTSTETESSTPDAQQLVGNAAVVDYVRDNNKHTGPRVLDPNKNGIVYMGLNQYSHNESRTLGQLNAGDGGVRSALPQQNQDTAVVQGKRVDLSTLEGASAFASSLGLPDQQAVRVAEFMMESPASDKMDDLDEVRDELAQLIQILAEAEMGERKIDRMVFSGHSLGTEIWGEENGELSYERLTELFEMFPKAASQVKHLMMSACYGGGEATMSTYQGMMPELVSVWAYHNSSPGTWTGAMDHMGAWEKATEPGKDPGEVDPDKASKFRKGKNVATWNTEDGYQGGEPMSLYEIEEQLQTQEAVFERHFSGSEEVANAQSGPLRNYYGLVQRAISHPEASSTLRAEMTKRRDQTIRLLYFKVITAKFQQHNSTRLEDGFREAGITLPKLDNLGRGGIRDLIAQLKGAARGMKAVFALDLLERGLWNLDNDLIPTAWV